jgi:hypothetical protein
MEVSVNQNQAVNTEAAAESAPAANQEAVLNPPLEGNPSEQNTEKAIPYNRFKEVIDDRNLERAQRMALEARLRESQAPRLDPKVSEVEDAVKNYVAAGLTENAARVLVDNQLKLGRSQQADMKAELHGYKVNEWTRELKEGFKDYAEVSVEADKQFSQLSPEEKDEVMSSRRALHNFYKAVRSDYLEQKINKSFNDGATNAYKNQQLKQGMANSPGKAPVAANGGLSRESLRNMSPDEFKKRLPEINEALSKGLIK